MTLGKEESTSAKETEECTKAKEKGTKTSGWATSNRQNERKQLEKYEQRELS